MKVSDWLVWALQDPDWIYVYSQGSKGAIFLLLKTEIETYDNPQKGRSQYFHFSREKYEQEKKHQVYEALNYCY